ncbi:MAG: bifunctional phosphoribosylaminoimidazolecarboxamide formyltransferase/inosine monophosphate cyclohydrolase, partial [Actinobacteria bacterium]|nr:bifunctional phosphoribosylaminoimidazolecarboxamide formyltransferase/inosine monophosphate cyclohydrolase [Actinomycetota bacterium]
MSQRRIRRALISVSDRTGLLELTNALISEGVEIIASDGTANYLKSNSFSVRTVSEITGAPELLGGKVKTLHPIIHAAILADQENPEELRELLSLSPIDAVIVNLYPAPGFDIGGPALIRAAAKNAQFVSILTHPRQYRALIEALPGGTSLEQRNQWAHEALVLTAEYDLNLAAQRGKTLRYGENPQQSATLLTRCAGVGVAGARLIHGKEMSFNNYQDVDAAWLIAKDHPHSAVIIKHGIPTGVALADSALAAYKAALKSDPISAFGGVIAINHDVDEECAAAIIENFTEVVVATSFTQQALEVFASKPNLRILLISNDSAQSHNL